MIRVLKDERGFSLIEMMVYTVLAVIVLSIVGGMIINSIKTESTVRDSNAASATAQLVSRSIAQGVRNASALELTAPVVGEQQLRVRTIGNQAASAWGCQSWYIKNGEVRTKTSTTAIATPTAAQLATWTVIADKVNAVSPSSILTLVGRRVDLVFTVNKGTGVPVLINTSAQSRQPVPVTGIESLPCF